MKRPQNDWAPAAKAIVYVLLFLVFAEIAAGFILQNLPLLSAMMGKNHRRNFENDGRVLSPAYSDRNRARIIFDEFAAVDVQYQPYVVWQLKPFAGATISIDGSGKRRTCNNRVVSGKPLFKIWLLGGSNLFGTGSEDCQTVASFLAREISDTHSDLSFEISNFGTSGYQSTQEVHRLMAELRQGARPDLVLTLDGPGDLYYGVFSPGIPGAHQNLSETASRFDSSGWWNAVRTSQLVRLASLVFERRRKYGAGISDAEINSKTLQTLSVFQNNVRSLRALAHDLGFRYRVFWAPTVLSGQKVRTPYEEEAAQSSGVLKRVFPSAHLLVQQQSRDFSALAIEDLSDVFDRESGEIYLDYAHLTPLGNRILAHRLFTSLLANSLLGEGR